MQLINRVYKKKKKTKEEKRKAQARTKELKSDAKATQNLI